MGEPEEKAGRGPPLDHLHPLVSFDSAFKEKAISQSQFALGVSYVLHHFSWRRIDWFATPLTLFVADIMQKCVKSPCLTQQCVGGCLVQKKDELNVIC